MREQFVANLRAHFGFYRRNHLMLVLVGMFAFVSIGFSFWWSEMSQSNRFDLLRGAFSQVNFMNVIFTATLALFLVHSHVQNRNLKMILTKPCSPETWLLSVYVSAALVSVGLAAAACTTAAALSWRWDIPFQAGFVFQSVRTILLSATVLGCVVLLSLILHPTLVVAGMLLMLDSSFSGVGAILKAMWRKWEWEPATRILDAGVDAIYFVLPISHPFLEQLKGMGESMRVPIGGWLYLAYSTVYALVLVGFLLSLSDAVLRRRCLT